MAECGLQVLDFADLTRGIREADIIISSVSAPAPIITPGLLAPAAVLSHKYFVDLSMPHSVAAAIEMVPGVLLYPLDAIQSKASAALERRLAAVPQVRAIIAESLAGLQTGQNPANWWSCSTSCLTWNASRGWGKSGRSCDACRGPAHENQMGAKTRPLATPT